MQQTKETRLRAWLGQRILSLPESLPAEDITPEAFPAYAPAFFEAVLSIAATDISAYTGYGEFDDNLRLPSAMCLEELTRTFDNEEEGYWYHWREMFNTTLSRVKKKDTMNRPIQLAEKATTFLEDIDVNILRKMNDSDLRRLERQLDKLQERLTQIREML